MNYYRPQRKFAKVMSLHVCVCPRGGGGGILACIAGFQAHAGGGELRGLAGGGGSRGLHPGGAGGLLRGGWRPPPVMATAAGGTHPTGMHSCF